MQVLYALLLAASLLSLGACAGPLTRAQAMIQAATSRHIDTDTVIVTIIPIMAIIAMAPAIGIMGIPAITGAVTAATAAAIAAIAVTVIITASAPSTYIA